MLALAGALAMPGMAIAQDSDSMGDDSMMNQPSSQGSSSSSMGQSGMGSSSQSGMSQGSDVRTGMQMGQNQQVDVFKNKSNFKVDGTVSSVDATQNMITVQRSNGLPPVQLQVASGTDIKMDGRQASLNQLQPGSEVRAEFNVAENQPIAVKLDAKQSKQQKRSQSRSGSSSGSMGTGSSGSSTGSSSGSSGSSYP